MAWNAISGTLPQYEITSGTPASGYYLAFTAAGGTSIDINMATDNTGGTELARCVLDSSGYPTTDGTARFIPFINQQYRLSLYPSLTDAEDKTNPVWVTPDLYPIGEKSSTVNVFYAENYDSFSDAITAAAGKELVISQNTVIDTSATVSGLTLRFIQGGNLDPDSGVTITLNCEIQSGLYQIFDGLGTITFGTAVDGFSTKAIYPQWWGAVGDTTTASSAAILLADSAATATANTNAAVTFPTGIYSIDADITLVSELILPEGSELNVESGITLTVNGAIDAGHHTIFRGSGTVLIRDPDNTDWCNTKIDHIKEKWFTASGGGGRIQKAIYSGGSKSTILCPIGREMNWGTTSAEIAEIDATRPAHVPTNLSHVTIKGAGGMFGTEYVIPAGAGIVGIDLKPASATVGADEARLQDFRLIEESGSVISTCLRAAGTSLTVSNVWLGNADYGWLVDEGIGGHCVDNLWIEGCNTNMAYENTGACSQGLLNNIQLFDARVGGVSLSLGEGAGGNRIKNLRFSNLDINNQDPSDEDNDSVGLRLGAHADGIKFSNIAVRKCNGRAIDLTASNGMPATFSNLAIEDCLNLSGDAYGLYFTTGDMDGVSIDGYTYDDVDIPLRVPTTLRGVKLDSRTDNWSIDDNSITFKNRVESGSFTSGAAVDVFTLTFPNAGPLSASVEVRYSLYDIAENSTYFGVETFACLSDASSTMSVSSVDQVSGVTAGASESISVVAALAVTHPGSEGTVTYSINQTHDGGNACYGEFEVRVVQKGPSGTLGLNPNRFEWDV